MGIQRVGHVVIKMRDLEKAKAFYQGVLGMKIGNESPRGIFFRFGDYHHDMWADGWTVVTKDHSLSAQWEHTCLVTETGVEVLTLGAGSKRPAAQ